MAAPVTVADDEVLAAGRSLAADGRAVNGWSLRRVLGRGDPTRLGTVWQVAQAAPAAGTATGNAVVPLPSVVADRVEEVKAQVADLAGDLWRFAECLALQRLQGETEAARTEAANLRVQLDDAQDVLARMDILRDVHRQTVEDAERGARESAAALQAAEERARVAEGIADAARADLRAMLAGQAAQQPVAG